MYLVTEIQTWPSGIVQTPTYAYADQSQAEAKYYSILAAAAVSTMPVHAAMLFTDEGFYIMSRCYKHPQPEPEPEPEEPEEATEG